jgi:hypothetical protein
MTQSPGSFCKELRSKKFYSLGRLPVFAGDYLDESQHCWCHHTEQEFGPDGDPARPERCVSPRACWTPFLELADA